VLTSRRVTSAVARRAGGTFALRTVALVLGFIATILLARLLGASGYGAYGWALAWVGVLRVLALLGLDRFLIRELAVQQSREAWGAMRGLLRRARQVVAAASFILAAAAVLVGTFATEDDELRGALWIALPLIPATALLALHESALQGLQRVVRSQVPNNLVRPLLVVAGVVGGYLVLDDRFGVGWAIGLQTAATLAGLALAVYFLRVALPTPARTAAAQYDTRGWARSAMPMLVAGGVVTFTDQLDIIMVGALLGAPDAGLYTVAARGAALLTLILIAFNTAFAPLAARLHALGQRDALEGAAVNIARGALVITAAAALLLAAVAEPLLSLFGEEFADGATAFRLLLVGYVVYAAAAPTATILLMAGREREAAWGLAGGSALNLTLNAALIPRWGINGAAVAGVASTTFWNLLLALLVARRLGIGSTALGARRRSEASR
jgi:O-antigen/teichoic acid export membrane protein